MAAAEQNRTEKKPVSLFDLSPEFFDSVILLGSKHSSVPSASDDLAESSGDAKRGNEKGKEKEVVLASRWTCNTCRAEFESLSDQRAHFKSDLHRLNVKLNLAGKKAVKEEEIEGLELNNNSFLDDLEVSSISGSESEEESDDDESSFQKQPQKLKENSKQKIYFTHPTGDTISVHRSFLLDESEEISFSSHSDESRSNFINQDEILNRLKRLISEPRDKTHVRIVLLASGGHFAGCVFDGKSVLAHKTFHRYVVRAKAGKQQSSQDASGKIAHSAGSSIRRHNEAALKREIQELMSCWKVYFESCKSVLIHAPSRNRQMYFSHSELQNRAIQNIPLTVRRPTFKEAKRIYNLLSHLNYEQKENINNNNINNNSSNSNNNDNDLKEIKPIDNKETKRKGKGKKLEQIKEESTSNPVADVIADISDDISSQKGPTTELHLASKSGNFTKVLELLESGMDPSLKDERGRSAYGVAGDKEVRNVFRRFMAENMDKWDWKEAGVPSGLTKEMEESQAAKQAEKDAKRKARAKELKKIKKAKEKEREKEKEKEREKEKEKEKKELAAQQKAKAAWMPAALLTPEERERRLSEEREKRAAAAERRMAGLKIIDKNENVCSYCCGNLEGKVPFHRYSYKYCSPTCMHVHGENMQDI